MGKIKVVLPFETTMAFHNCYDGGNKYIHYFSRALVKQGINVTIVTSSIGNDKIEKKYSDGVEYVFIPYDLSRKKFMNLNAPYRIEFSKNVSYYLESIRFDILHSFGMFAFDYLHKKDRNPVITQPWGLEPFYGEDSLSKKGLKKIYVKWFIQRPWLYCLKNSDKVASEGDFQLDDIVSLGVEKKNIFPLLIGIDLDRVNNFGKNRKDKRKELGINKEDLVLLSVCQIAPDKGIEDIIEGFKLVKKEIKNAKLIMIGSGVLEEMMIDKIYNYGLEKDFFHFKNVPEKELYDYFFSSDLFVSAATQKDWIMGVQEAMACGLPVISSAQPFLVQNGENGYIVGMRNPEGIKKGILKIVKGRKLKNMGKKSLVLSKKYSWDEIAKSAIKEYNKLLKR